MDAATKAMVNCTRPKDADGLCDEAIEWKNAPEEKSSKSIAYEACPVCGASITIVDESE